MTLRALATMLASTLATMLALRAGAAQAAPQAEANFDLGRMYRNGAGVARDSVRAFALIDSAARDGLPAAMFIASSMLAAGEGTSRDVALARRWLEAAAELENPEAMQQLAMHLREGAPGYQRDEPRAARLLDELAHAMKHRAQD